VDASSGTIVHQWARCTQPDVGAGECLTEEGEALTASSGLPGGLGAGPFWNDTVTASSLTLPVSTPLNGSESWRFAVEEQAVDGPVDGPCLGLSPSGDRSHEGVAFEFTGGLQGFTLCDGVALPASFTSLDDRVYRLERYDPGSGSPLDVPSENVARDPPLGFVERESPVCAAHPEIDTNFTTQEAHREARNRVSTYDAFFEDEAVLVSSHFSITHRYRAGQFEARGDSTTYERTIQSIAPDGEWVRVEITKKIQA